MFARVPTIFKTTVLQLTPTENVAQSRLSALTSRSPPPVAVETLTTCMCAAATIPETMPPPPPACQQQPSIGPSASKSSSSSDHCKSKVDQLRRHLNSRVTSPIDIYRLELELANHLEQTFVSNLLSIRREGAHIGFSGSRSPRVPLITST